MAANPLPKQFAAKLAGAVTDASHVLAYRLLLEKWGLADPSTRSDEKIERVLDEADVESVRRWYLDRGMEPAVYFYEEFARACDPASAKKRGVHYSPPQVVSFMVQAVESVLATEFGEALGDVTVVDPCCGAGTFLNSVTSSGRTLGIELCPKACRIAQLIVPEAEIVHGDWLGECHIDSGDSTLVVIGNPPYSGHSANPGKIAALMADYKHGLLERNPKWLQDDYVKFIRMAQHHVCQPRTAQRPCVGRHSAPTQSRGIVAFITNHSYLFNPTFRAMRASLMRDFDRIYVVDLQGNSRRNDESAEIDQNVFPIQMGVGISLFVRTGKARACEVRHMQIRGSREEKLAWLSQADFPKLPWNEIACAEPFNVFVPQRHDLREEYERFPSILDLFGQHSVGFVTSRDAFAVDVDKDALLSRIQALRDSNLTREHLRVECPIGDLDVNRARAALKANAQWRDGAVQVLYRPFDVRWAYYSPAIMERPRLPFMQNMIRDNLAIVVGRAGQATGSAVWDVAFCADMPVDLNLFRRGGAMILPRYVYDGGERRSNINWPGDHDQLFWYIYAILFSPTYRTRYADFLSFDFPRIPIPDQSTFGALAELGRSLMDLHLMRRDPLAQEEASLTIGGYVLPDKFTLDRSKTGLTENDDRRILLIRRIAAETKSTQTHIDSTLFRA
jgi:predicted helicase